MPTKTSTTGTNLSYHDIFNPGFDGFLYLVSIKTVIFAKDIPIYNCFSTYKQSDPHSVLWSCCTVIALHLTAGK